MSIKPVRVAVHPHQRHDRTFCIVQRLLSNQSIPNDTNTLISFDVAIAQVGGDFWDIGSPTLISVPVGLWQVAVLVKFAAGATGYRFMEVAASEFTVRTRIAASPTLQTELSGSSFLTVEGPGPESDGLRVRHTQGVALDVEFAEFRMERLTT